VISLPFAHVGGIPLEETLTSLGPALLVAFGVGWSQLRARLIARRRTDSGADGAATARYEGT
jgi:hypothetical protein